MKISRFMLYLLALVVYILSLTHFTNMTLNLGITLDQWPLLILWTLFWIGLIEAFKRYTKITLITLFSILILLFLFREDLTHWALTHHGNLLNQIVGSFGYSKLVPELPYQPVHALYLLPIISLIGVLILWINPISLLALALFIVPLFFIENLSTINWLVPFILGLGSVLFFMNRHKQLIPHFPLMGSALALLLLMSQITSPAQFFYHPLNHLINNDSTLFTEVAQVFSLRQVGFSNGSTQIGGPVSVNNDPFMAVTGPSPSFYLKGVSYSQFEDDTWILDSEPQEVFDNQIHMPTLSTQVAPVFDYHKLNLDPPYDGFELLAQVRITPVHTPIYSLFHGGTVFTHENINQTMTFDKNGTISTIGPIGSSYDLLTLSFPGQFNHIEAFSARPFHRMFEPSYQFRDSGVLDQDPQLYDLMYNNFNNNPTIENLMAVVNHLRAYEYSLDVPFVTNYNSSAPGFSNAMATFFDSKVGYCVYFASALTLMLLDSGFDARYTEGFLVPQSDNPSRTLRNNQAHAWTEVYLDGYGWIVLDPTPSVHVDQLNHSESSTTQPDPELPIPNEPDIPEPEPTPEVEPTPELPTPTPTQEEPSTFNLPNWVWMTLLGGAYLFFQRNRFLKRHDPQILAKRFKANEKQTIQQIYADILNLYKLNMPLPHNTNSVYETLSTISYFYRIKDERLIIRATRAINDALYSQKKTHPLLLDALENYYLRLEKATQIKTNKVKYNLLRIWFNFKR